MERAISQWNGTELDGRTWTVPGGQLSTDTGIVAGLAWAGEGGKNNYDATGV